MKEENEIWKDIIGYENIYQVSNMGNVKSLKYNNGNTEKELVKNIGSTGYCHVVLSKYGKVKIFNIHILVAITFLNHVVDKYKIVVDHINNDKTDNRIDNLQLISQRENIVRSKTNKTYTSKYTGVSFCKNENKWISSIYINGKCIKLGRFTNEIEASKTYQIAVKILDLHNGCNTSFRKLIKEKIYKQKVKQKY